ncbi:MAG: hypothetical protein KF841_05005 [Phycisphaerae bacterium]|nr:hypothetical protein [Phycisphaerae bacterium]
MSIIRIRRMEMLGVAFLSASLLIMTCTGCDELEALLGRLLDRGTRVEVTNNGDYPVDAVFYISGEQNIPRALLVELGERIAITIEPGQTMPFVRDCDDLQAIVLDDADLRVIGAIGPETSSEVLRDGTDFGCRDTILFTFDHSAVLVDFDVTTGRAPD